MPVSEQNSDFSDGLRLTGVFVFWFVMLTIALALIVAASPDVIIGMLARAAGAIPLLLSSMLTGQSHARRTGALVPNALAWKLAFTFALIALLLSALVAAFMLPLGDILGTLGIMFAGLVAFIFIVAVLAARVLLNTGAKSVLRAASR